MQNQDVEKKLEEILKEISPETYKEELGFSNSEVLQAMREAYNMGIDNAAKNAKITADGFGLCHSINKDSIISLIINSYNHMTSIQQLSTLIERLELSKAYLAKEMNMNDKTFRNKLSGNHTASFTEVEQSTLCNVLIKMRDELQAVESMDFNDAIKILAPKTI